MAALKANSARRREVRRNMPRATPGWSHWVHRREVWWAALFTLVFSVVSSLVAITAKQRPMLQVGQVAKYPVVARVEFRAIDPEKTFKKKTDARDREPAYYTPNEQYLAEVQERLLGLVQLGNKESIDQISESERQTLQITPRGLDTLRLYVTNPQQTPTWEQLVGQFMEDFAGIAALDDEQAKIEADPQQRAAKIVINHPTLGLKDRYDNDLINAHTDQKALAKRVTALANRFTSDLRQTVVAVVMQNPRPIYRLDTEETQRVRLQRFEEEKPVEMIYRPGSVVVKAGDKVQSLDLLVLEQEQQAYLSQIGPWGRWMTMGGLAGLITLIGTGLWGYILAYNPRVVTNPMRGVAILTLLLACQAMAVLGTGLAPKFVFVTAVFPILLTGIILTIAYNQRFALGIGAVLSLVVLVSLNRSLGFGVVILTGLCVAVALLHDVRNRSTLVKVGLWSGVSMGAAMLLQGMALRPLHLPDEVSRIGIDAFLVLGTGFVAGLVVQGVLPWIETLFNVTTSMTLRELNDASHPLLRRLAQEAPGTYQHSLRMADMSEAAADSIGANGLLCKVGAMYHDMGKVNKPMYFVENQGDGPNRHNKLSPAMSLLIIVGHVKDGMEMAREYGLPRPLRHFIESHHGTTLVEYFYHAAKQRREAEDKPAPTEFEFRYPGPKPQTKEAAILMLCDGVESAARTLDEPTSTRIEQLVHAIANKRLMDGQFDECSITLQDLHKIEQSLVKTLCATYHSRIKYPGGKQEQPTPTEDAAPQDNAAAS